jgi:serine protease Do
MAKAFGLPRGGGALIGDVTPSSPAAKSGIERGDVVLELNGQTVNGPGELSVRISQLAPGSVAHLKVFRDGQAKDIDVTLGEYPEKGGHAATGAGGEAPANLKGVRVQNLTPDIAKQLGLPSSTTGVVVNQIDPLSPAAAAGIQQGDVIQEVNRKPVRNVEQYDQALAGSAGQTILLLVNRGGTTHFVVVQPQ